MSWWDWLRGRSVHDQSKKEASFPFHIPLVPSKLSALVHLHEIVAGSESVPCWTYVTEGLASLKQKEVIFTLVRNRDERPDGFPEDPLHLFRMLFELAGQGKLVDVGGFTQFGSRAFFGRHLAYLEPQPLHGVPLPQSALVALLVTLDDLRALQEFGATRLISRLGQARRYCPFPPWSDRLRPGLPFDRVFKESILLKAPRAIAKRVSICQTSDRITITVPQHDHGWRRQLQELPVNAVVALMTDIDPGADGCFVWEPGQAGPAAITPPGSFGSRVSGCFVLFLPDQPADGGQIVEDGFAMSLTPPSWVAVRNALIAGEAISIPAVDGRSLQIVQRMI